MYAYIMNLTIVHTESCLHAYCLFLEWCWWLCNMFQMRIFSNNNGVGEQVLWHCPGNRVKPGKCTGMVNDFCSTYWISYGYSILYIKFPNPRGCRIWECISSVCDRVWMCMIHVCMHMCVCVCVCVCVCAYTCAYYCLSLSLRRNCIFPSG